MYNEQIGIESLTQSVCDLALRFGEDRGDNDDDDDGDGVMSRPFGVALLLAVKKERKIEKKDECGKGYQG